MFLVILIIFRDKGYGTRLQVNSKKKRGRLARDGRSLATYLLFVKTFAIMTG